MSNCTKKLYKYDEFWWGGWLGKGGRRTMFAALLLCTINHVMIILAYCTPPRRGGVQWASIIINYPPTFPKLPPHYLPTSPTMPPHYSPTCPILPPHYTHTHFPPFWLTTLPTPNYPSSRPSQEQIDHCKLATFFH